MKKPSSASWEHGAKVCIADIQDEAGQQLRDTLGGGDVAMFVHCDVTVEEDASAAVPRFAEVPARMLAGARELDALHGVGSAAAAARKLPLHLFAVYDGHGGSEVGRSGVAMHS